MAGPAIAGRPQDAGRGTGRIMTDVYLSYERSERSRAQPMHDRLAALGLTLVFDGRPLARDRFVGEIEPVLRDAPAVLVLWTPRAVRSGLVLAEAGYALDRGRLCAAVLEPCAVPFAFLSQPAHDLSAFDNDAADPAWHGVLTRLAALTGHADLAQRDAARPLANAPDPGQKRVVSPALADLIEKAGAGDPGALVALGLRFEMGDGMARDEAEAARLYGLAADRGDPLGRTVLAALYRTGRGVAQDLAQALRLYRLAADQGLAQAQFMLGVMLEHGQGTKKDPAEAGRLFRLAAAQDHEHARKALAALEMGRRDAATVRGTSSHPQP